MSEQQQQQDQNSDPSSASNAAVVSGLVGAASAVVTDVAVAHSIPLVAAAMLSAGVGGGVAYMLEHDGILNTADSDLQAAGHHISDTLGALNGIDSPNSRSTGEGSMTAQDNAAAMPLSMAPAAIPVILPVSHHGADPAAVAPGFVPECMPDPLSSLIHDLVGGVGGPIDGIAGPLGLDADPPPELPDCGTGRDPNLETYLSVLNGDAHSVVPAFGNEGTIADMAPPAHDAAVHGYDAAIGGDGI